MTLRNHSSARTLTFSLLLALPLCVLGCWEPELKNAEIGCGLDPNVSPKCPNRDADPPSPDGAADSGSAAADAGDVNDTTPVSPDSTPDAMTAADAPVADAAVADSAVDSPAATDANSPNDSASGSDALVD